MDVDPGKRYHIRHLHLVHALKSLEGVKGRVLDVGCGGGGLTAAIKGLRPDLEVVACDKDRDWLESFKREFGRSGVKIAPCDAHNLPFDDESFEAVMMLDVLEHLEDPRKALSEVSHVLKKNGTFHLAVPCEADLATFDGWIKKLWGKNLKEKPLGHIQQFTFGQVKEMLSDSGFKVKRVRFSYHLLYQFFSLIYYLYVTLFKGGEYVPWPLVDPEKKFRAKIILRVKVWGGWLSFLESSLLARIRGQTAHITAIKR